MSKVPLSDSQAISKRLKNCKQDIEDFMTGITNNMTIDFDELCQYINIEPCQIAIKCVDGHAAANPDDQMNDPDTISTTKREKLIQFTISLQVTAGLLDFLATAFRMIDDTKIISLCFVDNGMNAEQLELLKPFQQQFADKLYSLYVHHVVSIPGRSAPSAFSGGGGAVATDDSEYPEFLNIVGWQSIRIVSFKNDRLSDYHCSVLTELLQKNQGGQLTALMLDFNEITSNGFMQLMTYIIEKVPSALVLSFSYNCLTDDALESLQSMIEKNGLGNMQSLRIMFNRFSEEKKQSFQSFLQSRDMKCNICL